MNKYKNLMEKVIIFCGVVLILVGTYYVMYYLGYDAANKKFCSDEYDEYVVINSRNKSINLGIITISFGIAGGLIIHGFPFTVKIQNNYNNDEYYDEK